MVTLVNLTGSLDDLVGTDFVDGYAKVWITTNVDGAIVDSTGNSLRLGDAVAAIEGGAFTFTGLWATNSATSPTSFYYKVFVQYTPKRPAGNASKQLVTWNSGWFTLTATSDLADVVEVQDVLPTQTASDYADAAADSATAADASADAAAASATAAASSATDAEAAQAAAEAARDDAELITGLDTVEEAVALVAPITIKPEQFGAVGDGTTNDTAAVVAAAAAVTAARQAVIGGNVYAPGATLLLEGSYKLTTLSSTIVVSGNIDGARGKLIAPAAFADAVLTVGHETSAKILQAARMDLPAVTKTGATSLPSGSVGVKVQNLYDSVVNGRRIDYFETAWWFTGLGQGTAYNEINLGRVDLSKVAYKLAPQTGGWVNQNTFKAGGVTQSSNTLDGSGIRRSGWRHAVLDGTAGVGTVNGNTFEGVSFEGDLSEYYFDIKHASNNVWQGATRFEQGTAARATTLSTDTFTDNSHGLAVGDMVLMYANTTLPGGMKRAGEAYFVSSVPTANTFKIAETRGGTSVSFTTNGSGVVYYVPPRIKIDGNSGVSTYGNEIKPGYFSLGQLDVRESNGAFANRIGASLPRRENTMPGRNRIINGDFRINQRAYVSGTSLASGTFCFDRWKSLQAATTVTFTSAPQGQMVALNGYIGQVIERAQLPAGTYTLSWEGNAQGRIYRVGDTAPAMANGPITFDCDGTTDVAVEFIGSGESRLFRVQLELGTVATPFEQEDYGLSLRKCKRYFQRYGTGSGGREMIGAGIANATTAAFFPMRLMTEMRTTPTVSVTSGTTFRVNIGTSVILASGSPTLDSTSNSRTVRVNASVAAGLTTGQVATLDTGDGFFDLSAEL